MISYDKNCVNKIRADEAKAESASAEGAESDIATGVKDEGDVKDETDLIAMF